MSKNQVPPVYNNVAKVVKPLRFIRDKDSYPGKGGVRELGPKAQSAQYAADVGNGRYVQFVATQMANA